MAESTTNRVSKADVNGKTILFTGSTDGVGRWVAERLGAQGARVLVHGRDRTRGEAVVTRIAKAAGAATFLNSPLMKSRFSA